MFARDLAHLGAFGDGLFRQQAPVVESLAAREEASVQWCPHDNRYAASPGDGKQPAKRTLSESIALTRRLRAGGLDMRSVSVGFSTPTASIPWGTAFLAPIAERVRREAELPVSSAWGFEDPLVGERVVADGQLDLVMVGRSHLADPHYPYAAALKLGVDRPSWVLPAPYAHWLERYRPGSTN